jgi:dTDP-4-amino-4,6-dideoxygalactose transaminase
MRVHGQGSDKYDNVRIGMNSRLDTMQAAILLEKLKIFPDEVASRQQVATRYSEALTKVVSTPTVADGITSVWAQYTVRIPEKIDRSRLVADLKAVGVPTMIYYVKPLHQQKAYEHYPVAGDLRLPVSEELSDQVLSLPMSGYLDKSQVDFIIENFLNLLSPDHKSVF